MPTLAVAVAAPNHKLLSSLSGRQRWHVPAIADRPLYAYAVQAALRKEPGVRKAEANPRTGRVLIEWDKTLPNFDSRGSLSKALALKPVSLETWRVLAAERKGEVKTRRLVGKMILGGFKLGIILANRVIWGAGMLSPLTGTITVLSLTATLITGYDFLRALWRTVTAQSKITTGTLIGAATLSSIALRENVTALIVLWLLNLGEYLEILTLRRTRRAITDLLSTGDEDVWLAADGVEVLVPASVVLAGDLVVVHAGRKISVDGEVEEGSGTVNEAPITGESMPVVRSVGESVYAGSILLAGTLRIRVTGVGNETVVGKLIQRVEQAQTLRPQIQKMGDAFAKKVVPSSFAAALLVLIFTGDPRRALTMLLVACPCAAGLATPTAVSASIGNGARRGILIKGGTHIEAMSRVDTICFDKTGTLTDGHPTVQEVIPISTEYTSAQVLAIAARAERQSQHPLALAILECAGMSPANFDGDDGFEILAGRGVRCSTGTKDILVGNARLLQEFQVAIPEATARAFNQAARRGETMMYVVDGGTLAGMIGVYAQVRPEAVEAVRSLKESGIDRMVMLTGDSEPVAASVAAAAGVTEWKSRLLPQDKFDAIWVLRDEGRRVAMVGDGVNDAPALALADVGIAMGTAGSDVAIETADIALAADDLRNVASILKISRHTMGVIRQNYALALGTSSFGLYLGAMGSINPIIAAVLHNLSTILVVANSSRLIHFDPAPSGMNSGSRDQRHRGQSGNPKSGAGEKQDLDEQAA